MTEGTDTTSGSKNVQEYGSFKELARHLGIETCLEFDPRLLVPEERIRALCYENKCGNYGSNYTCPPYVGSTEENKIKLCIFQSGLLLQYTKEMDVKNNKEGVLQTKVDFHQKMLRMEELMAQRGVRLMWGMIGGNCGLCDVCKARTNEPCPYPDKARMSLEAIAIDVLELLDKLGLDNKFRADRITWTGCILFNS